ncbi:hypothetical protein VNO77_28089 [Canavalia gladiata]|uniref:Uncharacterized protein n=1 Tax=Canavalia gladiata TaxID=3824 RepID=A0AAN9QB25_CANGL
MREPAASKDNSSFKSPSIGDSLRPSLVSTRDSQFWKSSHFDIVRTGCKDSLDVAFFREFLGTASVKIPTIVERSGSQAIDSVQLLVQRRALGDCTDLFCNYRSLTCGKHGLLHSGIQFLEEHSVDVSFGFGRKLVSFPLEASAAGPSAGAPEAYTHNLVAEHDLQECAVSLLCLPSHENDESKWAITAAYGIPPLVQILETGSAKENHQRVVEDLNSSNWCANLIQSLVDMLIAVQSSLDYPDDDNKDFISIFRHTSWGLKRITTKGPAYCLPSLNPKLDSSLCQIVLNSLILKK